MFDKNRYIGSHNRAGGNQYINVYINAPDYQKLEKTLAEQKSEQERLVQRIRKYPDDEEFKLELRACNVKIADTRKEIEDFKENVFRLYELFTRILINTERLRQAKEHFDRGEFREADAVLKAEEINADVERLKLEERTAEDRLAAVRQDLADRANELLLKAIISQITPPEGETSRFKQTEGYFEQALAAARTPKVLGAYALFLHNHREFRKSEPLWQEALKKYRGITEGDSEAIAADIAITLNNLGALHKAITDYDLALKEYEEALNIYRPLAKSNPTAFRPYLATTLNNLANLHFHQNDFGPALEAYQESLKIGRSLAEVNREAFLPGVAQTLHNMANLHCETREHGKALEEYRESLSMYHDLAKLNPESFLPYLATTLNSFANLHSRRENFDLALEAYQKALKIRRGLAEANPEAFLPDVAQTLHNMANLHFAKKEHDQALGEYKEALKTYRSLSESNPEAFLPDVATTLNSLAALHGERKNYITAIEEFEEALQIRRKFGKSNPKAFLPYVAETLVNLSIFHLKVVSDKAKSVAYAEEAHSILIPLCKQAPHLQKYLDMAELVLKANAATPAA